MNPGLRKTDNLKCASVPCFKEIQPRAEGLGQRINELIPGTIRVTIRFFSALFWPGPLPFSTGTASVNHLRLFVSHGVREKGQEETMNRPDDMVATFELLGDWDQRRLPWSNWVKDFMTTARKHRTDENRVKGRMSQVWVQGLPGSGGSLAYPFPRRLRYQHHQRGAGAVDSTGLRPDRCCRRIAGCG